MFSPKALWAVLTMIVWLFSVSEALAGFAFTSVRISSTLNPVGSGARALGMGGAFIAVADDATAASWNPGGLIQLETPEMSAVYSFSNDRDDYSSAFHPEINGMNEKQADDLNYFSVALPFQLAGKNFVASLNYQRLYDMYKDLQFGYRFSKSQNGTPLDFTLKEHYQQNGGLKAFAPALACQVTPRFSVGATFNIWSDDFCWNNGWSETTHAQGQGSYGPLTLQTDTLTTDKYEDFEGFNLNLGFLWNINRVVTLGGVYKTPFTARLRHRHLVVSTETYPDLNTAIEKVEAPSPDRMKLNMPASYGLGIAFRLSDDFTWSFDVYRTEWSKFFRIIKGYPEDFSDIDNRLRSQSDVYDTTQIRTGMEYLFILEKTIIPLRLGLFYDPRPSHKHPQDFWGCSVGSGFMIGNLVFDGAYQFRTGKNVAGGFVDISQTTADVEQHTLLFSIIYHVE